MADPIVHYEDFAEECDGEESMEVSGAIELVTCQHCLALIEHGDFMESLDGGLSRSLLGIAEGIILQVYGGELPHSALLLAQELRDLAVDGC